MLCPSCGTSNSIRARSCGKCGGALQSSFGGLADELRQQAQQDLSADGMAFQPAVQRPGPSAPAAGPAGQRSFNAQAVDQAELVGLIEPSAAQVQQSANFTFASPFIQGNPLYRERISRVNFIYAQGNWTLNAYATDHPIPLSATQVVQPPAIVFYAGLATALRLASAALAVHIEMPQARGSANDAILAGTFQLLGQAVLQSGGAFPREACHAIFAQRVLPLLAQCDQPVLSLARSYVAAMESFIVAHEAGHLALCHTLGQRMSYDVSRNQEREADSFAASTLISSPFREYLFLGSVLVTIIMTWVDHAAGAISASTHPLSRERFMNLMQSNSSSAAEAERRMGLSQQRLAELLPRA